MWNEWCGVHGAKEVIGERKGSFHGYPERVVKKVSSEGIGKLWLDIGICGAGVE